MKQTCYFYRFLRNVPNQTAVSLGLLAVTMLGCEPEGLSVGNALGEKKPEANAVEQDTDT